MGYKVEILADSMSKNGHRLTTMVVTFPRIVLSEFNTHRIFSRNSASSRAIPTKKMIEMVESSPFIPRHWGKNRPGMQASQYLSHDYAQIADHEWMQALKASLDAARKMERLGVHKQHVNRLLEPFMWHTVIVSATEWENFFALRCNLDAQPEIHKIAFLMRNAMRKSHAVILDDDQWHLPLVPDLDALREQYTVEQICRISAARCARVSYLTHDGQRDPEKDLELYHRLSESGHMSPMEHVAIPMSPSMSREFNSASNFRGWIQLRKLINNEHNFALKVKDGLQASV